MICIKVFHSRNTEILRVCMNRSYTDIYTFSMGKMVMETETLITTIVGALVTILLAISEYLGSPYYLGRSKSINGLIVNSL